jgi:hypothetical protein
MNRRIKIQHGALALATAVAILLVQSVRAEWSELKLMASDAAANDDYGRAVSVSGHIALIASPYDDDAGSFSGSAYLADVATGQELFKLTASDAAADDKFGTAVAIRGNTAIVGSPYDDDTFSSAGSAYLFNVATGQQSLKLTASDPATEDYFGAAVAVGGGRALVGAYGEDDGGSMAGAAYVFDVTNGRELAKLTASDAWADDRFGVSLALSGNMALIGANGNDDAGAGSGSAYLFNLTTSQETKLTAGDAAAGDSFGESVAISGSLALVGAPSDDDAGPGSNSGSAYLFNATTGQQLMKFTASDAVADHRFGYAVAISGDLALIGAFYDDDVANNAGAAYLFDVTTGQELAKLTASDGAASDYFGYSLDLSGNTALIGAFLNDERASGAGAAYVYVVPEPATSVMLTIAVAMVLVFAGRRASA